MKKYFIFGGSGFIGTHLASCIKALDEEAAIYNLDIVSSDHDGRSFYIYCDVRNAIETATETALQPGPEDVIFNLAAIHRTPGHPDYDYFETNIRGAENVCAFAEKYGIRRMVFTSSIAPYGASEHLKEETTLPTPNTPYGISKLLAEKIHQIWQRGDSLRKLLILRPGVVFGKGENGNFTRLYWAIRKRCFLYAGRKDTIKSAIYVKDLVHFMLFMTENSKNAVEVFNCTYEPAYSIEHIVETIKKVTGLKRKTLKINASLLLLTATIVGALGGRAFGINSARVRKIMVSTNISGVKLAQSGYRFKYSFEEALTDWYADNDSQCLQ